MLPHTLDIKNGLLFTDGGISLLHRIDTALSAVFSPLAIVRYHHTQMQGFIAPCEQWAVGPCPPVGYWKDLHYLRKIRAVWWAELLRIILNGMFRFMCPTSARRLLWSNLFSEVGMVAQISDIHSITEPHCRASYSDDSLPTHLQELLDQTSRDLDST